jgi:serine/threonine-protein kinase
VSRTFPIAAATDVFGLASIAYECLTGRPPFPAKDAAEAHALIVAGKRPLARDVRHELNPEVDRLLAKAWSVDPRSRPHDIMAFASTLAAALIRPAGALAEPQDARLDFDEEEDAETVNIPAGSSMLTKLEAMRAVEPVRVEAVRAPLKAPRAQTLPFGMQKAAPSDPPPNVPKIINAPVAEPAPEPPAPRPPAPQPPAPPPAPPAVAPIAQLDPEVRTVRVVSVTGVLVSLVIAGAVIIAGAFVGAGSLIAQRAASAPPPQPKVVASTVASPVAAPPTPSPAPSPKTVAPAPTPTPEPVALAVSTSTTAWPELAKEPGPRPSAKALEVMRQKLKVAFEPCLKIPPKAPQGIPWMVHFEFDAPSGQPVLVDVSRPFKGTLGGACMMREALDARVPPFDGSRWAIDLRFGP